MIAIKSVNDVIKLPTKYQHLVTEMAFNLFNNLDGVAWVPDDNGYFILLEAGDDLTNLPHLNSADGGIYCRDENGTPGIGWEDLRYYREEDLYEILILCNNDFGITYFIPAEIMPKDLEESVEAYITLYR
jgi:hypothetical protein